MSQASNASNETVSSSEMPKQEISTSSPYTLLKGLLFLIVIFFFAVGAYTLFGGKINVFPRTSIPFVSPGQKPTTQVTKTQQWVNCNDVREIIEEDNSLYVACMGGVLVVDKNSGEVLDQITMTQGLGNNTTTSLIKQNDVLYIGTQDGFTIFNLKTRDTKKMSVGEGLISGSNIELALDGNNLWVGSFEGLSLYSVDSGQIINFTSELADNSTKYNANKILITPKAVYVTVLANAHTPGGIARYDKAAQKWERFGPAAFGKTDQYVRMDLFHLVDVGDKILVAEGDMMWEAEDKQGSTWKKLDAVLAKTKEDADDKYVFITKVIGGESVASILLKDRLYTYDSLTSETKMSYPNFTHGENILANGSFITTMANKNKIWMIDSRIAGEKGWLKWFDITSFKGGRITLKGRPTAMDVIATIDGKPLIMGDNKVWVYNPDTTIFKELIALKDFGGGVFQPIANSTEVFVFLQSCEQACSEPKMAIYDYQKSTIKPLEIPDTIMEKIQGENTSGNYYSAITFKEINDSKEASFLVMTGTKTDMIRVNTQTNEWSIPISAEKENIPQESSVRFCNKSYSFEGNGRKFKVPSCLDKPENQTYRWEVERDFPRNKLWQVSKASGERKQLEPQLAPEDYSPFGQKDEFSVKRMMFADSRLWIGTNRGLVAYDPSNETWKLFSSKDGLVSNDVENFVIDKNVMWVTSHWNGISVILY